MTVCNTLSTCASVGFSVVFTNSAPSFAASSTNSVSLSFGSSTTFNLPAYSDPDGDSLVLTSAESGQSVLPAFVSLAAGVFTINPNSAGQAGVFTIDTSICDGGNLCSTFTFTITVIDIPVLVAPSPNVLLVDI